LKIDAFKAGIRQARLEQQHGIENDERRDFLEQVYGRPPRSVG